MEVDSFRVWLGLTMSYIDDQTLLQLSIYLGLSELKF